MDLEDLTMDILNSGESESDSHAVVSDSLRPHGLYSPWNSPGQNTGVGSLSLLQGIFPTQGSNPGLPYCRWSLYQLSHKGSPRILEWVTYPFSRGSSWPRNRTGVFCIGGGFFTNWATGKANSGDVLLNRARHGPRVWFSQFKTLHRGSLCTRHSMKKAQSCLWGNSTLWLCVVILGHD